MMLFKIFVISIFSFCLAVNLFAYDTLKISAELNTILKQIVGRVEYQLPPGHNLSTFEFQLFPNVYSSEESPYLKGEPGLQQRLKESGKWGSINIDSILVNGVNFNANLKVDYTKGVLSLGNNSQKPTRVKLYFTTVIPETGDRLFYYKDGYLLDGWFPFPALLLENGQWYNPDYSRFAELVGDYFIYEVTLGVPSGFIVAYPGSSMIGKSEGSVKDEYRFLFGPASDFALALAPDYLIDDTSFQSIEMKIYYRDYEWPMVSRVRNAILKTMEFMTDHIGPYEYRGFNCVFSDIGFSGGIEFPGIIALSTPRGDPLITHFYEMLTVHETVHQWFYAMVGSDQVQEPWMDEAITNLFTLKIFGEGWGKNANLFDFAGIKLTDRDMHRLNARPFLGIGTVGQAGNSFTRGDSYFSTVYNRGALALETIDNLMGDSLSDAFWRQYFAEYKFKHADALGFRDLLRTMAGEELANLFDILINNPVEVDYSVTDLYNRRLDSNMAEVNFILHRRGLTDYPVEYRVNLSNGDSLDFEWNPRYDTEDISLQFPYPAVSVEIDPDFKFSIDANLMNNSSVVNTDNRPGFRLASGIMYLIESILSFAGGL